MDLGIGRSDVSLTSYTFAIFVTLNRSLAIYSKLVYTPSTLYVVGLAKSYSSLTLHVTALSVESGQILSTANIPSNLPEGPASVITLSRSTAARLAWLEQGSLKSVSLSPTLKDKPTTIKGASYRQLQDIGLSSSGYLIAVKYDGTGCAFRLEEEGSALNRVWEFDGSVSPISM